MHRFTRFVTQRQRLHSNWQLARTYSVVSSGDHASFIPVLDIAHFKGAGSSSKAQQQFLTDIRTACETSGFIYIKGHGLDTVLEDAQRQLKRFFELPVSSKAALGTKFSRVYPQHSRGWVNLETLDPMRQGIPDQKESLEVGLERPQPANPEAMPFTGPNNWPEEIPELKESFMTAVHELHSLSLDVCRALALSLGADAGTFVRQCQEPMLLCRGLYYEGRQADKEDIGCSAHTDYGIISLLHQTAPGLQVLRASDEQWIDALPIEGTLVVNIGDLMQRWTNGKFKSTVHRVQPPPVGTKRQSIGLFLDANFNEVIAPLSECTHEGLPPLYEPIHAGEAKLGKFKVQAGAAMDEETKKLFDNTMRHWNLDKNANASRQSQWA